MAKRRSSLKGRGSEILFGEPAPVDIEPRGPVSVLDETVPVEPDELEPEPIDEPLVDLDEPTPAPPEEEIKAPPEDDELEPEPGDEPSVDMTEEEPPPPPPEETLPAEEEDEVEKALYEEAKDGEIAPEEEQDQPLGDEEPSPEPEAEPELFEELIETDKAPEPVAELPALQLEEPMEELFMEEEEMFYEPLPPETSDVPSDLLPPRESPIYVELEDMESLSTADIQESSGQVKRTELPERMMTEEEEARLIQRYGLARLNLLDKEISRVYDQVLAKVGENENIATDCFNLLLQARDIVLRRDAARLPQAEYYVEQARARLKRATESESGAKKYSWRITAWGLLWGAVFIILLILLNHTWFQNILAPSSGSPFSVDGEIILRAMIWGGIGGVVAVLYSLFKHVGRRDFDSQYNLSYIGKPFLGLVLGATVYMVFQLMLTLGVLPAGLQTGTETSITVTPWIIYPLAWAGGFKENRIFDLIDRVIKRLFSGKEAEDDDSLSDLDFPTQ